MTVGGPVRDSFSVLSCDDERVLLVKRNNIDNSRLEIPAYVFTASGRELFIATNCRINYQELCLVLEKEMPDFEELSRKIQDETEKSLNY